MGSGPRIVSTTRFGDLAHGLRGVVALHAAATVLADLCLSEAHRVGVVGAGRRETQEFVSTDLLAAADVAHRGATMLQRAREGQVPQDYMVEIDEEAAPQRLVLTQRLFPNVSELQGHLDGVAAMPHRLDALEKAA